MAVINIFVGHKDPCQVLLDEVSKFKISDILSIDDNLYVVSSTDKVTYYNYETIVYFNKLSSYIEDSDSISSYRVTSYLDTDSTDKYKLRIRE